MLQYEELLHNDFLRSFSQDRKKEHGSLERAGGNLELKVQVNDSSWNEHGFHTGKCVEQKGSF